MISNARGKHSAPGVYIDETDVVYSTRNMGITTLGVIGETLMGPAFEPITISDWAEFQEYFGGTSTEKFKKTQYPKYELPYIAKSYLQESKQLEVCRVLGFSGYNAGPAWALYATDNDNNKYVIGILRSKGGYNKKNASGDKCNPDATYDVLTHYIDSVSLGTYTSVEGVINGCDYSASATTGDYNVSSSNYGRYTLLIQNTASGVEPTKVSISLNAGEKNYIVDVLGMKADEGDYPVFVEEFYDVAYFAGVDEGLFKRVSIAKLEDDLSDYRSPYRYASTPWFVSELKGNGESLEIKKLFRFHTISDGNAANSLFKVSISNILPDEGLFDVTIRDFNDTDAAPIILEKFSKCNMVPGSPNYIGLKIGTFNGDYDFKSKYVTVEVIESDVTATCVPCGFLGFPMRKYTDYKATALSYNKTYFEDIKPTRQYFGMSDIKGVDLDVLTFKGVKAYKDDYNQLDGYSNGFHLDSLLNMKDASGKNVISAYTVDGKSGYVFETVDPNQGNASSVEQNSVPRIASEREMESTIYADKKLRKFTCYFYGGFDGWDIYREERTNTGEFRANKYKGLVGEGKPFSLLTNAEAYNLNGKAITSDYYAYLAGYKQFINPHKVKINLLATPGIDYVNNLELVNEVLDIVEEYRQGDCLYVVTTPDKPKGAGDSQDEMYTADDVISNLENSELNTSYAATYYPWVRYYDASNKKYINLPVTKDVVRNFAHTDNVAQPWFASAGMSRGNVECVKAHSFTKLEDEDTLYEGMVNPVKSFGADGVKIWGNKTMYLIDSPLNRINVRRLMIRVKDLVSNAARQLLFEQNDNTVEAQFRSLVEPILANAKQNRGISDFKIKTDTSAEARDRHELPARIWIKPIGSLEFISISFVVTPEGASFEE